MNQPTNGCMAPPPDTWRDHLRRRFFPARWPECPDMPDGFEDMIRLDCNVHFDFADRLRILVSGRIFQRFWIPCEKAPGKTLSTSTTYVECPKVLERREARP